VSQQQLKIKHTEIQQQTTPQSVSNTKEKKKHNGGQQSITPKCRGERNLCGGLIKRSTNEGLN
jgi:hypothetical protein